MTAYTIFKLTRLLTQSVATTAELSVKHSFHARLIILNTPAYPCYAPFNLVLGKKTLKNLIHILDLPQNKTAF